MITKSFRRPVRRSTRGTSKARKDLYADAGRAPRRQHGLPTLGWDDPQRLRLALEASRDGVWDWDMRKNIAVLSPRYCDLVGYRADEIVPNRAFFEGIVHPDDLSRLLETLRARMRGEDSTDIEYRIVKKGGDRRWLHSRGVVVERDRRGRPLRMIGTITDVTERKLAELALRENEARLAVALKSTRLLVFHQDRDLRYTWIANPAFGLTRADVIGRTDEDLLSTGAAAITAIKRRVLKTGRGERQEVWASRAGRSGYFDLIVEPRLDDGGRVVGVLCAAADVTDRVSAERALEESRRRLRSLALHQQETIEAERAALARDVHDDVGAALTGIRLKLAAIAARLPESLPARAEILAVAEMATAAVASTREICARLRPPSLDDLGLAETCRWYLRDWSRTTGIAARGRFAGLRSEPAPALATDIFRILQELLTNVARHSASASVRVTLAVTRGGLRLVVADAGRGFDPTAPTRGFGLAGARERASRHGGRITITSGRDGTAVTLTIPGSVS